VQKIAHATAATRKLTIAETHPKSGDTDNIASKIERYYTAGYAPQNGMTNPTSAFNLKGCRLEESGFITRMLIISFVCEFSWTSNPTYILPGLNCLQKASILAK